MLDEIIAQWRKGRSLRQLAIERGCSKTKLANQIARQIGADEYRAISGQHLQANKCRMHKGNALHQRRKRHGSHPALPLLSVRVIHRCFAGGKQVSYRYIKVGPRRWISLARYRWELEHAPVPAGYFIGHADGDSMNNDPSNLWLVRAAVNARAAVYKCDLAKRSARFRSTSRKRRGVTARLRQARAKKLEDIHVHNIRVSRRSKSIA